MEGALAALPMKVNSLLVAVCFAGCAADYSMEEGEEKPPNVRPCATFP
jgi:hypothetical protein